MTIQAIFFDLDGVLVDAVALHRQAFTQAVRELAGVGITKEEHDRDFDGLPTKVKLAQLVDGGRVPADLIPEINLRKQALTQVLAQDEMRPDPVKIALCKELQTRYLLAVVSNCVADTVKTLLNLAQLEQFFAFTVSNEDVERAKPHPDPYLFALKMTELHSSEALAIEDNHRGIRSAFAAGLNVLQVEYSQLNLGWFNEQTPFLHWRT